MQITMQKTDHVMNNCNTPQQTLTSVFQSVHI